MKKIFEIIIKKFYGRFNGKLFSLVAIPCSYLALLYLLLKKKRGQIIILPTTAIGDTLYILSFWLQLYDISKQGKIQIYISNRYKKVTETFSPQIKGVEYLKHSSLKLWFLLTLSAGLYNSGAIKIAKKCNIYSAIPRVYASWLKGVNLNGTRNQLSHILNIPLTPIVCHNLSKVPVQAIDDFQNIKSKICVMNPFSYSMKSSGSLYEKIAEELSNQGFIVYTNVIGSQKAVRGTLSLEVDLEELFSIACEIPLIVSVRSGILDFLIPSKINMFVIYDEWNTRHVQNVDYSIEEWKPQGKVCEISIKVESEDIVMQRLKDFLYELTVVK